MREIRGWFVNIKDEITRIIDRFEPGGKPQEADLAFLRKHLRNREGPLYEMLYTLGRAGRHEDALLVREFIAYNGDVGLPSRALRILCFWVDEPDPYFTQIVTGIAGEIWDSNNIHKDACIGIAQDILSERYVQLLVNTLIDQFEIEDDEFMRERLFEALLEADRTELPDAPEGLKFEEELTKRLRAGKPRRFQARNQN